MIGREEILNASILIVDDSRVNITLLERMLKSGGYTTVTSTTDPTSVCALYDSNRYDLILLDLNLPKKHGREVLREIKADEFLFKIPVIVVTNSRSREDIEEVYFLRANCYLIKPPDIDEFFSMVRRIVEFWWETAQLPKDNAVLRPNDRNQ
jgi:CheY-like chemotaxis protein